MYVYLVLLPGVDFSYIFSGENFGENSAENFGENSAENFPPKNVGKNGTFEVLKNRFSKVIRWEYDDKVF
jgi:hypothetical protein